MRAPWHGRFAEAAQDGRKQLIVARVVLGVCAAGQERQTDTPPGAHSLVDRVANPSIYVVQVGNIAQRGYLQMERGGGGLATSSGIGRGG